MSMLVQSCTSGVAVMLSLIMSSWMLRTGCIRIQFSVVSDDVYQFFAHVRSISICCVMFMRLVGLLRYTLLLDLLLCDRHVEF